MTDDPRIAAVPDTHGHAKGEHKLYVDERPIPYTARMLFLWFFHACRRGAPRFLMVADHINYLTFEDPAAVNLVRRALKLAQAGDLYGAAETAGVEVNHAAVVGEGLRRGMRYSIGAEVDNDPRSRPDAQNIVDAMRPDGMVRSVHFLPIKHPQFGDNWMWPFDNPEFRELYDVVGTEATWELYMTTLLDAIEKLPGNIVGHFYVPAKFGHWPSDALLESYEDRLLEACAERGLAIEVNSRYFYKHAAADEEQLEKYRSATLRLLRKAKDKGVAIAVGSDAHSPKDQGRAFAEVLALLDRAEINEIAFPIDGRLARVALRATDELRRASALATRESRAEAVAIPGTEGPEAEDEDEADDDTQPAADGERAPAAAAAPATKKRPSRAKKAPSEARAPEPVGAAVVDDAAEEPAPEAAAAGVAAEAPAEPAETDDAEAAAKPLAPMIRRKSTAKPKDEPAGAEPPAPAAATPATAPVPEAASGEPPAAAADDAAADGAARIVSAQAAPEPSVPEAAPAASEPATGSKVAASNGVAAKPAEPQTALPPVAEAKIPAPKSGEPAARPAPIRAAPAGRPSPKRKAPVAKGGSRKAASGASKAAGAKKTTKRAVAKTSRRAAAPAAKKAAPKKSPLGRKAAVKAGSKAAPRASAKKNAKKPAAKKKATKSRR